MKLYLGGITMYTYTFKLMFAKKKTTLDFMQCNAYIFEAIKDINVGLTFKRDGKSFSIEQLSKQELILKLTSKTSLTNPTRTISALTRYLTTYHKDVFESSIFNKTLFSIELLSCEIASSSIFEEMSDEDLLKAMIDLLYGYTATNNADTLARKKTISEIKKLMLPYIKG